MDVLKESFSITVLPFLFASDIHTVPPSIWFSSESPFLWQGIPPGAKLIEDLSKKNCTCERINELPKNQ